MDQDPPVPRFNATTARLLRREALPRAAEELSTMTGSGLENTLAWASTGVTEEAAYGRADASGKADHAGTTPGRMLPGQA